MSPKKKAAEAVATPTPASKPTWDPPFVMVREGGGPVSTNEIKVDTVGAEAVMRDRGPSTGQRSLSDAQFVQSNATAEELRSFRNSIEARQAQAATTDWRTMPDGTRIRGDYRLTGCSACGRWQWLPKSEGPCPACNPGGRPTAGHVRAASRDEEGAWFERETKRWNDFLATKPQRDAEARLAHKLARLNVGGRR